MPYATNSSTLVTPTTKGPEFVYTFTDLNLGWVQECTSTSIEDIAGYRVTVCAGGLTTISTVSSIAAANSAYGASMNSVSSASATAAASVSAASAAAAAPTAEVLITYYTAEIDDVFLYQYRAYDGTPGSSIDYCWSAKPISFVTLDHGTGSPSDLPTNELPSFSTHGVKGCNYISPSNSQAGELTCPSWEQPVQCQKVVGSTANEHQCPDFGGGSEQQPIILCEWGVDP